MIRPSVKLSQEGFRTTIRTKLAVAITLLIGLIALFISLYFPRTLERRALAAVATRAQSIAEMTAFSAAPGLDFDDQESIEEAFAVARQNKDLVYLVVTEPFGVVVAAFNQQAATEAAFRQVHDDGKVAGDDALYKSTALITSNDRVIGTLYLGLSLDDLRADVSNSRSVIARLSLLLFVVGMAIVFGISTVITGPLGQIMRTVEQVAQGDLSQRTHVKARDEVGHLARAFNRMVEHLETAYQELKDLNRQLVKEKERAEEMAQLKSAFLTNMSHEIRTPLAGILGCAQILVDEVPEEHREFAQLVETSGQRLMVTLNSVLDLAQLEANGVEVQAQAMDVVSETKEVARLLQPLAEEKGLWLVVHHQASEAWALLDTSCFSRILNNLIGNAIKFTEQGGVAVEVSTDEQHVIVRVRDTGVGISEAFLEHLFDEFRQESSGMARSHEGSGLGLAITGRLTELMDGSILVESTKEVGSTFTVCFPRIGGVAVPPTEEVIESEQQHDLGVRVLVVEDNTATRRSVEHLLRQSYLVETVPGAEDGLRLANQQTYDLVLLDINLGGGKTGLDVLGELRALPVYADVPMIAMTAYALPGDQDHFIQEGFDAYLPKPFTKKALMAALEQALSKGHPRPDSSSPSRSRYPQKPDHPRSTGPFNGKADRI